MREGEASLLDGADLRVLRIGGLDRPEAAELLRGADVTGDAVDRLYRATGGNPLALLELAADAGRLPLTAADVPVPLSATHRRRRSCAGSSRCPTETRRLLVLAAAGDSRDG